MSPIERYASVTVPVRLVGSHNVALPGFQSARKGFFSAQPDGAQTARTPVRSFSAAEITVLGLKLTSFEVSEPTGGWQKLTINFSQDQTSDTITNFLSRLADALSASLAPKQLDPWHGNLVVEISWPEMRLVSSRSSTADGIQFQTSVQMTSEESKTLSAELLQELSNSDLTEIFVEGMRANRPKAKYASWFIMLEELERLAIDPEFSSLFTRLFPTKADRAQVAKASGLTGKPLERLQNWLGEPSRTVENRAEKLCALLLAIGITEVPALTVTTPVDVDLCQRLIDGRNALAHAGRSVDQRLLYLVLFPLSCIVMGYLNRRQNADA